MKTMLKTQVRCTWIVVTTLALAAANTAWSASWTKLDKSQTGYTAQLKLEPAVAVDPWSYQAPPKKTSNVGSQYEMLPYEMVDTGASQPTMLPYDVVDPYAAAIDLELTSLVRDEASDSTFITAMIDPMSASPLALVVESHGDGSTRMELFEGTDTVYESYLDYERFEVTSDRPGNTQSERWLRPAGDLLDFLDLSSGNLATVPGPGAFDQMPDHDLVLSALEEISIQYDGTLAETAKRVRTASNIYSTWWTATVPKTSGPSTPQSPSPPVADTPKEEPVSCTYPDQKTSSTLKRKLSIMGKADLEITANHVKISAFCETTRGCLQAASKVRIDTVSDTADTGENKNNCPRNGTEISGEEFRVAKATFHAGASVKEGCAKNYDNADTASAFKATLSAAGLADVELSTTEATGDGVAGESIIDGTAVVCYEDDPVYDDIQNLMFTGKASSKLW